MRSAELILILLSTLAISATLAQRSGRRFRPIGRREPEVQPLEEPVPVEEEQPELARPRFTPSIRKLGTFRPKSSQASTQNVQPEEQSFQVNPEPVEEQPRTAPTNRRSGSRGSRNFIESINAGGAGLRSDQIEKLKTTGIISGGSSARRPSSRPQNTVQRTSSRAQSLSSRRRPVAPIENVNVETEAPAIKLKPTSFKPISRPKHNLKPKPISEDEPLQPLPAQTNVEGEPIEKTEHSKQSLRRERIKQLKNRKALGGSPKKSKMMVDKPMEDVPLNPAADVLEVLTEVEKVDGKSMKKEVKLDSDVSKPLEQTIRETSTGEVTIAEQMMKAEKSQSKVKLDETKVDSKLNLETSSQEPSTTKTTAAPETPSTTIAPTTIASQGGRRISQLTRVRPERTRTRGSTAVTRTRASGAVSRTRGSGAVSRTRGTTVSRTRESSPTDVAVEGESQPATSAPRLSGRRGGRGNSRGGAALVAKNTRVGGTRSFTPRVSSRNRVRPAVTPDNSDAAAETTEPANRRLENRRRG